MRDKITAYYRLTKPGIVYGNAIHIIAGSLLAYRFGLALAPILGVVVGTSLVIASACVANNYIDRDIDKLMKRTKKRALATGAISVRNAGIYLVVLLVAGFTLLYAFTNMLVVLIGIVAYIFYVFIYAWAKRNTVHSTLIGSIPGALPAMAGYVALSGRIDLGAILVFALIVVWQMPHFYAISIFRKKDYMAAKLPVLGVVSSTRVVVQQMVAYIMLYVLVIVALFVNGVFGITAGVAMTIGAFWWLMLIWQRSNYETIEAWSRAVFGRSLVLSLLLLVASALNVVLP